MRREPRVNALEKRLTFLFQKAPELRHSRCLNLVIDGCPLKTRGRLGSSTEIMNVRGCNVSQHRSPEANHLPVHSVRNVVAIGRFESTVGAQVHGPGAHEFLEKRCRWHIASANTLYQ